MKIYSTHGYKEFIICCGYRGYMIKEYFADYFLHMSDVTFDFVNDNKMTIHNNITEPWKVTTVTAVQPSGKFGMLNITEDGTIAKFLEKPQGDGGWINGDIWCWTIWSLTIYAMIKLLFLKKDP